MTFVITSPCIDTQDQSCVDACPVDCIHFEEGADRILYINPIDCIDCGACQPACPVDAIFPEGDVADSEAKFIQINELWFDDPDAARAQVSGDEAPPAAAPAAEEPAPAEAVPAAAAATEAPAAAAEPDEVAAPEAEPEPEPEEVAPFRQVAASHGLRSAARPYQPSPVGFVAFAVFAATFFAMVVYPGDVAITVDLGETTIDYWISSVTITELKIGIIVLLGFPIALIAGFVFFTSQWSVFGRFAATRPRRTAKWRAADLEWRRGEQSRSEELTTIVNQIAHDRFAFPNDDNPNFRTYVNLPEPQMAIEVQGGPEKLLPDIVVLDKPGGRPRLIAQVESRETMSREQAEYVWARLEMRDAPLLLYVPSGMAATARDYVKAAGIKNAEVRTWRRLPQGMKVLELN